MKEYVKNKAFDSIRRGMMEEIFLAYGLLKETITAIMMIYKNMKAVAYLPDFNTDFFDIVARVLQVNRFDDVNSTDVGVAGK